MEHTGLRDWESFVSVLSADGNRVYYGGDQSWFVKKVDRECCCGTVAAANVMAYLAKTHSSLRNLYQYNIDEITQEDFIKHMNDLYPFVKPAKLPFINAGAGVPFMKWYGNGVENYAKSRGVNLTANWVTNIKGFKSVVKYIKEGLLRECPVAFVNWLNPKLKKVLWESPVNKKQIYQDFQFHWVTITALWENNGNGEVLLEVSSWGGRATICFNDIWLNKTVGGYFGLMHFNW